MRINEKRESTRVRVSKIMKILYLLLFFLVLLLYRCDNVRYFNLGTFLEQVEFALRVRWVFHMSQMGSIGI